MVEAPRSQLSGHWQGMKEQLVTPGDPFTPTHTSLYSSIFCQDDLPQDGYTLPQFLLEEDDEPFPCISDVMAGSQEGSPPVADDVKQEKSAPASPLDYGQSEVVESRNETRGASGVRRSGLERSKSGPGLDIGKKKLRAPKNSKVCTICGDRALGFNFDAITCESCKAFFRRNARKAEAIKCMFKKSCTIDKHTRRFCSACRLDKCFAMGMNKNMILDDGEKKKREEKVRLNKKLKEKENHGESVGGDQLCGASKERVSPTPPSVSSPGDHPPHLSGLYMSPGYEQGPLRSNSELSDSFTKPGSGLEDKILLHHISTFYYNTLGAAQDPAISDSSLQGAGELQESSEPGGMSPGSGGPNKVDVLVNAMGAQAKSMIAFAKKIPEFLQLSQSVQISLLKGSLLIAILLRSAQFFEPVKGVWQGHTGEVTKVSILETIFAESGTNVLGDQLNMMKSIQSTIAHDHRILPLLQVITLLCPDSVGTSEEELAAEGGTEAQMGATSGQLERAEARLAVSHMQDKYILLLKHLLEGTVHPYTAAVKAFSEAFTRLYEARLHTEKYAKLLLRCDINHVEPLILEVLDLR